MEVESETEDKIIIYVDFYVTYHEGEGWIFNDGTNPRQFYLEKIDGEWKIMEVGLGMSSLS